jgi:quercetin dioxygenase-like cupin family protein
MTGLQYVRLFAGPDGETHFEDVALELAPETPSSGVGQWLASEWQAVEQIRYLHLPPMLRGVAHPAPRRLVHVVLAGTWRLQTSDGESRSFRPGDVVLAEDTTGQGHVATTEGEGCTLLRIQPPS